MWYLARRDRARLCLAATFALASCAERDEPVMRDSASADLRAGSRETPLIDTSLTLTPAGSDGWNFQQSVSGDLDGDGAEERVVLTARVEMMRGRPAWDDGQPWQVYVESADGRRTHMYARYVQLGTLTLRLSEPDAVKGSRIVVLEQLPDRLAIYEGEYRGVGRLRATTAYERMLDPRGDVASPALP